jgi:redox-sensitive bicupin YhaK (pirin superfamily)
MMMSNKSTGRGIAQVVPATKTKGPVRLIGTVDCDGAGTPHPLPGVDPFILLDAGLLPKDGMPPFGPHPHRGHSVVTILLQGSMKSWDSTQESPQQPQRPEDSDSNREYHDVVTGPASYWVDAGTGLFHDEVTKIQDESDPNQHVKLFQLWVGVSEADRQKPPRIQIDTNLPTFDCLGYDEKNGEKQVVIGHGRQYVGPMTSIETPHPVSVAYITQKAGTIYHHPIDSKSFGGFVVYIKGATTFGIGDNGTATPKNEYDVLVLQNPSEVGGEDFLKIRTSGSEDSEYLVCTGEQIGESWAKKLVVDGAIIAATPEEARELASEVETKSREGPKYRAFDFMSQPNTLDATMPPVSLEPQNGIDIRQALDILSSRTAHFHSSHDTGHDDAGCCHYGDNIPEDLKSMGQTIDMLGSNAEASSMPDSLAQDVINLEKEQKEKAEKHKAELKASLKSMTKTSDLIRVLLRAQEDRVQTYQTYDAALQQVLNTGNLTAYPPACALATASFSMLSDTIRTVVEEMSTRISSSSNSSNSNLNQYIQWTRSLQGLEKEKLQFTAALHLERIRANNEQGLSGGRNADDVVLGMLQQGIGELEQKIRKCASDINVVLEDLRCALVEEMEEEEKE